MRVIRYILQVLEFTALAVRTRDRSRDFVLQRQREKQQSHAREPGFHTAEAVNSNIGASFIAISVCVLSLVCCAEDFSAEDRAWWAIQPVPAESAIPEAGADWGKNEIDRFVAKRLADAGLKPAPPAEARELVRRMYFDLHGLPPTPEQIAEFAKAFKTDRDGAVTALVDELLDSPRYAERWAQHWLDVVRYADSDGYRADDFRPQAYRYRDYVIRALHEDKPYDEFVRDQLAADEFGKTDPKELIATGFLRHGIYEWNQRNAEMHWGIIMDEMTRVTGEVFLGLGIGCAQCHDHKFDPILQRDYVALQSFLTTTYWPTDTPYATAAEIANYNKKLAAWEAKTKDAREKIDALMKSAVEGKIKYQVGQFPPEIQEMYRKAPEARTPYESQMAELVERQVVREVGKLNPDAVLRKKEQELAQYKALEKQLEAFEKEKPKDLPKAFVATDISTEPVGAKLYSRTSSKVVEPAFLALLEQPAPEIQATESSTGRRRALAKWIASPDNPLSTRVIANRIWQRHFGRGIVATPNDFGKLGEAPSHLELLDYLTRHFVDGGWKMKPMHRLIMTSATYQQTARREPSAEIAKIDPGNRLLWRFPPHRLTGEQVRDAMLAASGELEHRFGGSSQSGKSKVRSLYVKKMRNTPDPVLHSFDTPMGFESAPDRQMTTTPVQSLLLVNNAWPLQRAAALGKKLLSSHGSPNAALVTEAYERLYARAPAQNEVDAALAFMTRQTGLPMEAPKPVDKFPSEEGLRPIAQHFAKVESPTLGSKALWIQPSSRFSNLKLPEIPLGDQFTVEAVAILDRMYTDASVSTLISRWNGGNSSRGWNIGVTSERSAYQPRNFIVQLIGDNSAGNIDYEVVASDLRVPLNKPVYLAVSINVAKGGTITFYMKDLSDPEAKLQVAEVKHGIESQIQGERPVIVGGRGSKWHLWDGQVARLSIRNEQTDGDALVLGSREIDRPHDWIFAGKTGEEPIPGSSWIRQKPPVIAASAPAEAAVIDFCHALYNSNEFLYLH